MATYRALRGLTHTLAEIGVSRNNDAEGYWALGLLYKEALGRSVNCLEIHLWPENEENIGEVVSIVAANFRDRLRKLALSRRVKIERATLKVSFGSFGSGKPPEWYAFGDPFEIELILLDSAGRVAVERRAGRCRPHDPAREKRSLREETPND